MKTAVIDVGGGLRGIYAAGVLDQCMEDDIHFDVCIGVSAGSANVASYLSGQRGRNYVFYTEYALRRQYMSLWNFVRKGSYIDLDYVYGTLSNDGGENPYDYTAMENDPAQFVVVATNALTGEPQYFDKSDMPRNRYDPLKASCSIPFVNRPYVIGGVPYYDGALSDPIPVQKAFSMGCDRAVLILTKPRAFRRTAGRDEKLARLIRKKYPVAAKKMADRAALYNEQMDCAEEYASAGKLLIVAPADTCGMDTLTRDKEAMDRFYRLGVADGAAVKDFLR